MSARELASGAGLDPSQLNRYLKSKRMPELRVVSRLAEALGVSPAELLMSEKEREDLELARKILTRSAELVKPRPEDALHPLIREYGRRIAEAPTEEEAQRLLDELRRKSPLPKKKRVGD
jgi:transcriptional regulator with XRE-family HTH domain